MRKNLHQHIVIIGMGELGGVFARGFLRLGIPVVPVIRGMGFQETALDFPDADMVLLAVAEKDFHPAMERLPETWKKKLALLQNELIPRDWQRYGVQKPTVMAVWFEKKKGMDVLELLPTQVFGPQADLITKALTSLEIGTNVLNTPEELEFELALKNLFVFTINIMGLQVGGTTGELMPRHRELTLKVAGEVLDLQEILLHNKLPRKALLKRFVAALDADSEHQCRGRAAPERLARLLAHADQFGLDVPLLRSIDSSVK